MKTKLLNLTFLSTFIVACSSGPQQIEEDVVQSQSSEDLASIIEDHWQHQLDTNPSLAASFGDEDAASELPDLSPDFLEEKFDDEQALLERVKALDTATLTSEEKINAQILTYQLQNSVDNYTYLTHQMPLTAESGFHASIAYIARKPRKSIEDYEDYLAQLDALPEYFDQQMFWMRQGLAIGNTQPQVVLNGFEDSISAFIVNVEDSVYYQPFKNIPDSISPQQKHVLVQQGKQAVKRNVLPSYRAFYTFMTEEYMPGARKTIAASELPNGASFYQNRVNYFTTLDISADEVHEIGVSEVARIREEMAKIIEQVGFDGSFEEFLTFLRTDERFYPKTAEELLKEAAYISKKRMPCYLSILASYHVHHTVLSLCLRK